MKYINMTFAQYKVKYVHVYFCRFDEVMAIRKPEMMTFSITGSQIFFADFVIYTRNKRKTAYRLHHY